LYVIILENVKTLVKKACRVKQSFKYNSHNTSYDKSAVCVMFLMFAFSII